MSICVVCFFRVCRSIFIFRRDSAHTKLDLSHQFCIEYTSLTRKNYKKFCSKSALTMAMASLILYWIYVSLGKNTKNFCSRSALTMVMASLILYWIYESHTEKIQKILFEIGTHYGYGKFHFVLNIGVSHAKHTKPPTYIQSLLSVGLYFNKMK